MTCRAPPHTVRHLKAKDSTLRSSFRRVVERIIILHIRPGRAAAGPPQRFADDFSMPGIGFIINRVFVPSDYTVQYLVLLNAVMIIPHQPTLNFKCIFKFVLKPFDLIGSSHSHEIITMNKNMNMTFCVKEYTSERLPLAKKTRKF